MIKLKLLPTFPSSITGEKFLVVNREAGNWTIDVDFSLLEVPFINDLQAFETVVRDSGTGSYGRVPLATLFAATSFATEVTGDHAVAANETYLRCNLSAPATIVLGKSDLRGGLKIGVKDASGNFATNNLTVSFFEDEAADGMTEIVLDQNYQYLEMIPNATGWEIVHFG